MRDQYPGAMYHVTGVEKHICLPNRRRNGPLRAELEHCDTDVEF
jgi:hypothetical protein